MFLLECKINVSKQWKVKDLACCLKICEGQNLLPIYLTFNAEMPNNYRECNEYFSTREDAYWIT